MSVLDFLRAITPFVTLIFLVLIGIAGFFAKRLIDTYATRLEQMGEFFDEQLKALGKRQEDHEKDFLRFQVQMPRIYVLKDDHIRHITIVERKIDEVGQKLQICFGTLNADVKMLLRDYPKRGTDGER